jgi:hypothetical protein
MADDQLTPAEQIARLYEQAEAAAAEASERLVGSGGFASLLGQVAENVAALSKASGDALDGAVHNLRIAGRRDVIRLERQLARTEDKLERVLQEIEVLQERLEQSNAPEAAKPAKPVRRAKPDKPDQPDAEPRP